MRNQNLVGLKLPDLSEAAEQEKGRWDWGQVLFSGQGWIHFFPDP